MKRTKDKRGKGAGAKKSNGNNKKNINIKEELLSLAIIVIWLLMVLSFFNVGGIAGSFIKTVFFGLFGEISSWVLLIFLLLIIILPVRDIVRFDNRKITRIYYSIFLAISISSLVATITQDIKVTPSFFDFMKQAVNVENTFTGGIIGGVISFVLQLLFSRIGSYIITIAFIIAGAILLAHFSFTGAIKSISEQIGRILNNIKDFFKSKFTTSDKVKVKSNKEKIESEDDYEELYTDYSDLDDSEDDVIQINFKGFKDYSNTEENGESDEVNKNLKDSLKDDFSFLRSNNKQNDCEGEASQNIKNEGPHIPSTTLSGFEYEYPTLDLLDINNSNDINLSEAKSHALSDAKKLVSTLKSFGVQAKVNNVSRGPTVTRYEVAPSAGVKVSKIVNLADDIALNLAAPAIRIEAPIPGKAAVGIEIPNKDVQPVYIREVLESNVFVDASSKLTIALGKDLTGETVVADIAKMPHLLIAGSTGSGKSVCINSLIVSLIYKASPQELNMIMIDPKVVELSVYNGVPHLCAPVVTDPKKAAGALSWAVNEMTNRYKLFADSGVRDLKEYNEYVKETGEGNILPHYVIIIDELADLMMVAPREVEDSICRLAQMARAAGMHLIIATQRPSVDVITGIIKANIPSRIAFKVASQVDSRTILDQSGAEKLLGRGDMLFYPVGSAKPIRIQGAFISNKEVEKVVEFVKQQGEFKYDEDIVKEFDSAATQEKGKSEDKDVDNDDELLPKAIEIVVDYQQASISFLQRKLRIGYSRAARIIDIMEERGVISGYEGSKPRQVLLSKERYMEMKMNINNEN